MSYIPDIKKAIAATQTSQLYIDAEIDTQRNISTFELQNYRNNIVRVNYSDGKSVTGVINPDEPISVFGDTLRLNLFHFKLKTKLIENRKRVIPVADIKNIEILGEFKFDTIQL